MSQLEHLFILFSALSLASSFSVISTISLFPTLRKQLFSQLLFFVSLSDAMASVFSCVGFPPINTPLCTLQGFFNTLFYKAEWMWTVCLSHHLFCVFMLGKPEKGLSWLKMHIICWLIPLISTLLPLSTSQYGRDDDGSNGWCFIEGKNIASQIWGFLTFYLILFLTITPMAFFTIKIYFKFNDPIIRKEYPQIHKVVRIMQFYPAGMIICWGPNFILSILLNFRLLPANIQSFSALNGVTLLATQYGTVLAIIFFTSSRDACGLWWRCCVCVPLLPSPEGRDGRDVVTIGGGNKMQKQLSKMVEREVSQSNRPWSSRFDDPTRDSMDSQADRYTMEMLKFGGRPISSKLVTRADTLSTASTDAAARAVDLPDGGGASSDVALGHDAWGWGGDTENPLTLRLELQNVPVNSTMSVEI